MRNQKKKWNGIGRKMVSILLCTGMILPCLAEAAPEAMAAEKRETVILESSKLPADRLPEGDCVYFGTAAASVAEQGEYAVRIYREGDVSKSIEVEMRTFDMTAVYGEDYELVMDGVEETASGKTLLETYVKGQITEENEVELPASASSGMEENASGGGTKASEVSTLAAEKEKETGIESRKLQKTEDKTLAASLSDMLVTDAMGTIEFSSSCHLTFEEGEKEKLVTFRILEDDISEGTEGFSLYLASAEGADVFQVATCAVSIEDDEKAERSRISFAKPEYTTEDGKAVLTVTRTGAEQSVCDMRVQTVAQTAQAGVDYEEKDETLTFAPYETEKKIETAVSGSGSFYVTLTELTACEKGKNAKARVDITEPAGAKKSVRMLKKEADVNAGGRKTYEIKQPQTVDVPVLGNIAAGMGTGLLTFGKTWWDDEKTGYTLQIGLDGSLGASAQPEEKTQKYRDLHRMAAGAKADKTDGAASQILSDLYSDALAGTEINDGDIKSEKIVTERIKKAVKGDENGRAQQPSAGLGTDAWNVGSAFVLAFDFVYNPVTKEYMFSCGSVAAGGTYTFQKTAHTMISTLPAYVNVALTMKEDFTDFYEAGNGAKALTADEFDSYSGNLAQMLGDSGQTLSLSFAGKAQAAVGTSVILSPRGYVTYEMQFDAGVSEASSGGAKVSTAGGFRIDCMLFSVDVSMCSAAKGWGSLNHAAAGKVSGAGEWNRAGTQSRRAEEGVKVSTLLDGAMEYTRPKVVPLDDDNNKKMMVFIGKRGNAQGDDANGMALYYSLYDGFVWEMPKQVADDGTADSMPDVVRKDGKVFIAWADAGRTFTEEDTNIEKLKTMDISMAVYDIDAGTMGPEIALQKDKYLDLAPEITVDDTNVYISYMKRDLSRTEEEKDLLDIKHIYSVYAYTIYNHQTGEVQEEYDSTEKFFYFYHLKLTDPLVCDLSSVSAKVNGETYLLSTYTINEDEDFETETEVYLMIYNKTKDKYYFPIRITEDETGQSNPKLTEVSGTVYLTWVSEGFCFNMMNVTELLTAVFDTSEGGAAEKSAYINDDYNRRGGTSEYLTRKSKWYQKSAGELGMDETDYAGSIYEDLANRDFHIVSSNVTGQEDRKTCISSYTLTGKEDALYLFYTDFGPEEEKACVELYGVKYEKGAAGEKGSFGKAVQITDQDKVIDEPDLYMGGDGMVTAVSSCYEQSIDEEGNVQFGENKLVSMEFEPVSSIGFADDAITLPASLVAGEEQEIAFVVQNNGLADASGFDYTVTQVTDGAENIIGEKDNHVDAIVKSGECMEVRVPWTIPESDSETDIKISVTENGHTVERTCRISHQSRLSFTGTKVVWEEGRPYVKTVVKNVGNAKSEACEATLHSPDVEGADRKEYGKIPVPALASGQEQTLTIAFTPEINDFSEWGVMEFCLSVSDGKATVAQTNGQMVSLVSVCAQIENGSRLELKAGETIPLQAKAAPWNELAGNIQYTSSDPDIAVVDETGAVTGKKEGTVTIVARWPETGLEASVEVGVSGQSGTEVTPTPDVSSTPEPTGTLEPAKTPGPSGIPGQSAAPGQTTAPGQTGGAGTGVAVPGEAAGTKSIVTGKKSLVVAPGKTVSAAYQAVADIPGAGRPADVTVSVSGNKKISAKIQGSQVLVSADKKAVRGSAASVILRSKDASGRDVSAVIKVTVQNKTRKLRTKVKSLTLKKGGNKKITLNVTTQNKKKATTDAVRVSSRIVSLAKSSAKKKKVIVTLKGKKKGTQKVVIRVGSKKVRVTVKVV